MMEPKTAVLTFSNALNQTRSVGLGVLGSVQKAMENRSAGLIYALVEPAPGEAASSNFFCIDKDKCAVVWSISADRRRSTGNVFCDAKYDDRSNALVLWDWDGYRYSVDPVTGEIGSEDFRK